jgi:hypothetical protein
LIGQHLAELGVERGARSRLAVGRRQRGEEDEGKGRRATLIVSRPSARRPST